MTSDKIGRTLNGLTTRLLIHFSAPIRFPSHITLPVEGIRHSSCLTLRSGLQFMPAHGIIPKSQSAPPAASGTSPLVTSILGSQVYAHVALHGCAASSSPRLTVPVTNNCCQSHLAIGKCRMFGHPHTTGQESLLTNRQKR